MSCENFGDLSDQCRDVNLNRNKTQIHPVRCRNRPRGDPVDASPGGLSNFTTSQLQFEAAIEVSIYKRCALTRIWRLLPQATKAN